MNMKSSHHDGFLPFTKYHFKELLHISCFRFHHSPTSGADPPGWTKCSRDGLGQGCPDVGQAIGLHQTGHPQARTEPPGRETLSPTQPSTRRIRGWGLYPPVWWAMICGGLMYCTEQIFVHCVIFMWNHEVSERELSAMFSTRPPLLEEEWLLESSGAISQLLWWLVSSCGEKCFVWGWSGIDHDLDPWVGQLMTYFVDLPYML